MSLTSLIIEQCDYTVQSAGAPVHLSKVMCSAAPCILIRGWRNRLASGLSGRTSVLTWWVALIKTQGCITLKRWHNLSGRRTNHFCAGIHTCAMTTRGGKQSQSHCGGITCYLENVPSVETDIEGDNEIYSCTLSNRDRAESRDSQKSPPIFFLNCV